jgi:hypothetical protein
MNNEPGRRPSREVCTAKSAQEAVKDGVVRAHLDPTLFSFHSLRQGALTHMSAGNYSANSAVMNTKYDFDASELGPRASNSLFGGSTPGVEKGRRWIPARHEDQL